MCGTDQHWISPNPALEQQAHYQRDYYLNNQSSILDFSRVSYVSGSCFSFIVDKIIKPDLDETPVSHTFISVPRSGRL